MLVPSRELDASTTHTDLAAYARSARSDGRGASTQQPFAASPFDAKPIFRKENYGYPIWEADPSYAKTEVEDIKTRVRRDAAFGTAIRTRLNAGSKADWRVVAVNPEDQEASEIAQKAEEIWSAVPRLTEFFERIIGARIWGPAFLELTWRPQRFGTGIRNALVEHRFEDGTDRMRWHDELGWVYVGDKRGWSVNFPGHPLDPRFCNEERFQDETRRPFPYGRVAAFVNDQTVNDPWGWALIEGLYWCYLGKKYGLEPFFEWMRNYSGPAQLGFVSNATQRANMLSVMKKQQQGIKYALIKDQEDMRFENPGAGTTGATYIQAIEYFDKMGTLLTLHNSLSTLESESGTGTFAQAKVHDGVRMELVRDDLKFCNDAINHGSHAVDGTRLPSVMEIMLRLNGWSEYKDRVQFEMYVEEAVPQDPMQGLQVLQTLKQSGIDTTREDWYRATSGLSTRPSDDLPEDEILEGDDQDAGGMGGMMGMFESDKRTVDLADGVQFVRFAKSDAQEVEERAVGIDPDDIYRALEKKRARLMEDVLGADFDPIKWMEKAQADPQWRMNELWRIAEGMLPYLALADVIARIHTDKMIRAGLKAKFARVDFAADPINLNAFDWWRQEGLSWLEDYYADLAYQNATDMANAIDEVVTGRIQKGVEQGADEKMVKRELKKSGRLVPNVESRLQTITRTNMATVYGETTYKSSRESDIIRGWVLHTARDGRVRPEHIVLNGLVVDKEADPRNLRERLKTPMGFNCRCWWQAIPVHKWDNSKYDAGKGLYDKLTDEQINAATEGFR